MKPWMSWVPTAPSISSPSPASPALLAKRSPLWEQTPAEGLSSWEGEEETKVLSKPPELQGSEQHKWSEVAPRCSRGTPGLGMPLRSISHQAEVRVSLRAIHSHGTLSLSQPPAKSLRRKTGLGWGGKKNATPNKAAKAKGD